MERIKKRSNERRICHLYETIAGGNDWNEAETQQCKGKLIALNLDQTQYRVSSIGQVHTGTHSKQKQQYLYGMGQH